MGQTNYQRVSATLNSIQAIQNAVLYTRKGRITYWIEMYFEIKKQVTGVETFDIRYRNELESNYKCEK